MGKKKTHAEYVAELAEINPNIEVVGIYCGDAIKIPHRCKIDGHVWDAKPSNILHGKGCPICGKKSAANKRRLTHDEYVKRLKKTNPNIEVVEKYCGMNTKILHRCLIHDIEWNTTPNSTLDGVGCLLCTNEKVKEIHTKTHLEYVNEVFEINRNIEVVGKYINAKTPIDHLCKIHKFIWQSTPSNILSGQGCPKCGIESRSEKRRKSHEKYVEDLYKVNPNIIVIDKYINGTTPILHKCLLDNYEWDIKPCNALNGTQCPQCLEKNRKELRKTHEEYVTELFYKNPTVEVVEEYCGANKKILHHCLIHDVFWKTTPDGALGGHGCDLCHKERVRNKMLKSHDDYVNEVKNKNPKIKVIDIYTGANTPIKHLCTIHNVEWMGYPSSILEGRGCPKCMSEKIKIANTKTHDEYVKDVMNINPNIEVLGKYINAKTPILHKCLVDNYEWSPIPSSVLSGYGCPKCSESKGERSIRIWLERNNIDYIHQYKYEDCKDINPLPFDFYLPTYNILIEYDGEQHFRPIEYFGGQEQFEYIQKHDAMKNDYCKNNGIPLLRIPYYKFDNIEEELNNFLFI